MKVRCELNVLNNPEFVGFIYNNEWYSLPIFYNLDKYHAEYKITIGVDYEVIGIMEIRNKIFYLIDDNINLLPKPYPKELFSVLENKIDGVATTLLSNDEIRVLIVVPNDLIDLNMIKEVIVESDYGKELFEQYFKKT